MATATTRSTNKVPKQLAQTIRSLMNESWRGCTMEALVKLIAIERLEQVLSGQSDLRILDTAERGSLCRLLRVSPSYLLRPEWGGDVKPVRLVDKHAESTVAGYMARPTKPPKKEPKRIVKPNDVWAELNPTSKTKKLELEI